MERIGAPATQQLQTLYRSFFNMSWIQSLVYVYMCFLTCMINGFMIIFKCVITLQLFPDRYTNKSKSTYVHILGPAYITEECTIKFLSRLRL